MKLRIDQDACTGHGRCYSLAPDLFDADEYGHGTLRLEDVPEHLIEQAQAAVSNCPERAITIES
jgi:ferredoxin